MNITANVKIVPGRDVRPGDAISEPLADGEAGVVISRVDGVVTVMQNGPMCPEVTISEDEFDRQAWQIWAREPERGTVTEATQDAVLALVAAWIGKRGWTEDGSPAPTGEDAARNGSGPTLIRAWDWPSSGPTPTVILEGGPEDWAIRCTADVQRAADAAGLSVFVEPWASYALCIYPA